MRSLSFYAQAEKAYLLSRQLSPASLRGLDLFSTTLWHLRSPTALSFLAQDLHSLSTPTSASSSTSPIAWIASGNVFSHLEDHAAALRCFRRASQLDSGNVYAYVLSGHECVMLEEWDRALGFFREAVRRDRGGRCYGAWFGLGNVYLKTGKYTLAEYHFRRALEINQGNVTLVCCVGTVRLSFPLSFPSLLIITDPVSTRRNRSSRSSGNLAKHSRCTNGRSHSLPRVPSLASSEFDSCWPSSSSRFAHSPPSPASLVNLQFTSYSHSSPNQTSSPSSTSPPPSQTSTTSSASSTSSSVQLGDQRCSLRLRARRISSRGWRGTFTFFSLSSSLLCRSSGTDDWSHRCCIQRHPRADRKTARRSTRGKRNGRRRLKNGEQHRLNYLLLLLSPPPSFLSPFSPVHTLHSTAYLAQHPLHTLFSFRSCSLSSPASRLAWSLFSRSLLLRTVCCLPPSPSSSFVALERRTSSLKGFLGSAAVQSTRSPSWRDR